MPSPKKITGFKTAVVLPDIQIGYCESEQGLEPFHDIAAVDVAK